MTQTLLAGDSYRVPDRPDLVFSSSTVTPTKVGVQVWPDDRVFWIPAFAGMTSV